MNSKNKATGFTLIELMIVVVIIGILAALAVPRFMAVATRAKQTEAKQLLKQVYTMQEAYFAMDESYCLNGAIANSENPFAFAQIHVDIQLPARYAYRMEATRSTFLCTATGNLDDDDTVDTWTIDDNGNLECVIDDSKG